MPKLLIMGTNDPYWPLDALNLYYDDIPGENRILYVPNAGHGINDRPRLFGSLGAFALSVAGRRELPRLSWEFQPIDQGTRLVVRSDARPERVVLWTSQSPSRDFRRAAWESAEVRSLGEGWSSDLAPPRNGFLAAFAEAVYEDRPYPLHLSTNVRIFPPEHE